MAPIAAPTARPDTYVASLTGIRAVASGLVVLFHYFLAAKAVRAAEIPALSWFFGNGQTGVSIFFALSGFLITLRYRDNFARGTVRFRDYWLKRLIRIYPVYAFTLTFGAIVPALLEGSPDYRNPQTWLGLYGMGQAMAFSNFAQGIPVGWVADDRGDLLSHCAPPGRLDRPRAPGDCFRYRDRIHHRPGQRRRIWPDLAATRRAGWRSPRSVAVQDAAGPVFQRQLLRPNP
jgi:hypothetical protein